MKTNLFIDKISHNRDRISSFEEYPFNIEIIKNFNELKFTEPVTFFIGENGTGKSTFIEAIAIAMGLNAEGEVNSDKTSAYEEVEKENK